MNNISACNSSLHREIPAGDRALVKTQHLPRGDHRRHLLHKSIYFLELSKDGARWVIDHTKIDNVWITGSPSVLVPDQR